jgi:hypothetical protein
MANSAQSGVTPSRATLTLFLKKAKTSTLVYALPTTPLHALKSELYNLLQENAQHLKFALPDSADEIVFGAMIDPAGVDVTRGFHVISNQDKKKTTVKEAGLRDGATVAWKLESESEFKVEAPADDDMEDAGEA